MQKTLPVLALAVLAGALLLLRLSADSSETPTVESTVTPVGMDEVEGDVDLVSVGDWAARDEVEGPGSTEPSDLSLDEGLAVVSESPAGDAAPPHLPWMLKLRVDAPVKPGETPAPAQVQIRARLDGDPFAVGDGIQASCAIGEVTSIDIGSFRTAAQEPAMLSVTATHPLYTSVPMNVELIEAHVAAGTARAPVEATLRMVGALTVFGRAVVKADGGELAAEGPTRVAAWRSRGGQPIPGLPAVTGVANGDGEYSLRVPAAGEYYVAAVRPSSLPDGETCRITAAQPSVQLATFLLSSGVAISGQFVAGKGPAGKQIQYSLSRELRGPVLRFDDSFGSDESASYVWISGRLVPSAKSGLTQPDGRFLTDGLQAATYRLRVVGLVDAQLRSEPMLWDVQAPASNLRFDFGASTVAVRLVPHPNQPEPPPMRLFLTRPQGKELGSDEEEIKCKKGRFSSGRDQEEFLFTPEAPVRLRLAVDGAEDVIRNITTPRAGGTLDVSLHLPLGELALEGSLRIVLSGAVPPDGTSYAVHAIRLGADRQNAGFRKTSDDEAHVIQAVNGELVVPSLPVGPTRLAVYPATWIGHRASHHLDSVADVAIEEDLETTLLLKLVLGGRMRISKPDGAGGYVGDKCTIREPGGDPLEVQFIGYAANGGGAWGSDDSLLARAPSLVMPNLAPGRYEVQVGNDTQVVAVRAGEIVDVLFQ